MKLELKIKYLNNKSYAYIASILLNEKYINGPVVEESISVRESLEKYDGISFETRDKIQLEFAEYFI